MADHKEARERLVERLDTLLGRLEKIGDDIKRRQGPLDKDSEEQLVEIDNNAVLDGLDEKARAEVIAIRKTIARMDAGAYGICIGCGEPIAQGRLQAIPHTEHCVECAE